MKCSVVVLLVVGALVVPMDAQAWQRRTASLTVVPFSSTWFEHICFNQLSKPLAKSKCEQSLQAKLALMEQSVPLEPSQKQTLLLAGRTDIARFFSRYEAIRREFDFSNLERRQWGELSRQVNEKTALVQSEFLRGLDGDTSLFRKSMNQILSRQQRQQMDLFEQRRAEQLFRKHIEITLAVLDAAIPLTSRQRGVIVETLLSETHPPDEFPEGIASINSVLRRMLEIESSLRTEFSEYEWGLVRGILVSGLKGEGE